MRCITDLNTCCSGGEGIHRGDWYFPGGDRLQIVSSGDDSFERRGAQRVTLRRRNNAMGPSGIYRCEVPTVAVRDDIDLSVRETVYVGLYASGGNELINSVLSYILWGQLFRLDKPTIYIIHPACQT